MVVGVVVFFFVLKLISSLRTSYSIYWSHLLSFSRSSFLLSLPHTPNIMSFPPININMCYTIIPACVTFHWITVYLPGPTVLEKNWLSLFQQVTIDKSSMLAFGLWVCRGLVHSLSIAMHSYVQLPCCVQRTVSFLSTAFGSYSFSTLSSVMIYELWKKRVWHAYSIYAKHSATLIFCNLDNFKSPCTANRYFLDECWEMQWSMSTVVIIWSKFSIVYI